MVIRSRASGSTITDACLKSKVGRRSLYRWMQSGLFRGTLESACIREARRTNKLLDAHLPRAVKIMEEAFEQPDSRLRFEAAEGLLTNRGNFETGTTKPSGARQIASVNVHEHVEEIRSFEQVLITERIRTLIPAGKSRPPK